MAYKIVHKLTSLINVLLSYHNANCNYHALFKKYLRTIKKYIDFSSYIKFDRNLLTLNRVSISISYTLWNITIIIVIVYLGNGYI